MDYLILKLKNYKKNIQIFIKNLKLNIKFILIKNQSKKLKGQLKMLEN